MIDYLRRFAAVVRLRYTQQASFRENLLFWGVSDLVTPLVSYSVWVSVRPSDHAGLAAYFALVFLAGQLSDEWVVWLMEPELRSGKWGTRFLLPIGPFAQLAGANISYKLLKLPFFAVVAGVSTTILHVPLGGLARMLPLAVAGGLISLLIAYIVAVTGVWSLHATHYYGVVSGAAFFLSGAFGPMGFYPGWLERFASWLPFWCVVGLPVSVGLGTARMLSGLVLEGAWVAILGALVAVISAVAWRAYSPGGG